MKFLNKEEEINNLNIKLLNTKFRNLYIKELDKNNLVPHEFIEKISERCNKLGLLEKSRNFDLIIARSIKLESDWIRYTRKAKTKIIRTYGLKQAKIIYIMQQIQKNVIKDNKSVRVPSLSVLALFANATVAWVIRILNKIKNLIHFAQRIPGKLGYIINPFSKVKEWIDKKTNSKENNLRLYEKDMLELRKKHIVPIFKDKESTDEYKNNNIKQAITKIKVIKKETSKEYNENEMLELLNQN